MKKYLLILVLCFWADTVRAQQTAITLCSYYDTPPFVLDKDHGLLFDLVDELERQSDFDFRLELLPRKRLDKMLVQGKVCIVPLVHWSFFAKQGKEKFIWSVAMMSDREVAVSPKQHPLNYRGDISIFSGVTQVAVRGHQYSEFNSLAGQLKRIEVVDEEAMLQMLVKGRADFASISEMVYQYYGLGQQLFVAEVPFKVFSRHMLITKALAAKQSQLLTLFEQVSRSPSWQKIIEYYKH